MEDYWGNKESLASENGEGNANVNANANGGALVGDDGDVEMGIE